MGSSKNILEPRFAVFNVYSLVAFAYCAVFSWIYFSVGIPVLGYVHMAGLGVACFNWIFTWLTKNYKWGIRFILADGTMVVSFLFATGGLDGSGYLWPFAYLPYASLLTNKKESFLWMFVLLASCLILTGLHFMEVISIPYSNIQLSNYFASLFIFGFCIYVFQLALENYQRLIVERGTEVERLNTQLLEAEKISRMGSFNWDVKTGELKWSDELYGIYGVDKDNFKPTYENFLSKIKPDYRNKIESAIKSALEIGGPFEYEEVIVRPGGEERTLYTRGRVILGEDGAPVNLIGSCFDITEQKKNSVDLASKMKEIEAVNKFMINREVKMVELKKKIEELEKRLV